MEISSNLSFLEGLGELLRLGTGWRMAFGGEVTVLGDSPDGEIGEQAVSLSTGSESSLAGS